MARTAQHPNLRATTSDEISEIRHNYVEAAGQSFKAGELVYLVAGEVTQVPAIGATQILGIAKVDASTIQGTPIPVQIAQVGDELEIRAVNFTVTSGFPDYSANWGIAYGVTLNGADNIHELDIAAPGPVLTLVDAVKDRSGNFTDRVIARVVPSAAQTVTGA